MSSMWNVPRSISGENPVSLLRSQALELTQQTEGLLQGQVSAQGQGENIITTLSIYVPNLQYYKFDVVSYYATVINQYPGTLTSFVRPEGVNISDFPEFKIRLELILKDKKMVDVVENLLSQASL